MELYQNQPQNLNTPELPAPHRHFFNKKFGIILFLVLFLAVGAYASLSYWQNQQAAQDGVPTFTSRPPVPAGDPNIKTFTSSDLGFSFNYLADQSGSGKPEITAKQIGDKVFVGSLTNPQDGQWVQVWKKDPKLSLNDAVTQQFLKGYSLKNCWVEALPQQGPAYPANYVKAKITYPHVNNGNDPWWVNYTKCPKDYAEINGSRFFIMDTNHPDRFAYFNIGQDVILGDNNNHDWASTLAFTDLGQTECTMEAKQCRDGSYVSRTGPSCAFAACPGEGLLTGHVSIGPNCPVERVDNPCTPAPSAYTSRQVSVYKADGTTLVSTQYFDAKGNYSIALPVGTYVVKSKTGIGSTDTVVGTPTVKSGQTSTLNFSIDTGIR